MAHVIEMPKLSDTMDAGVLVAWKKNEGDRIEPGEVLAEVESDKATMELEAYDGGVLRKVLAKVGEPVPVGEPLAIVSEDASESIEELLASLGKNGVASAPAPAAEAKPAAPAQAAPAAAPAPASKPAGDVKAVAAQAGAVVVEMPKLSDTMDAGVIVEWKKKEGDTVEAGEVLADVESDKATMELEAYDGGIVRKLLVKAGDAAPVGGPLAVIASSADSDLGALLELLAQPGAPAAKKTEAPAAPAAAPAPSAPAAKPAPAVAPAAAAVAEAEVSSGSGRVIASPVAMRLAQEWGLDLHLIKGTGPGGRIVKRDVEQAKESGMVATQPLGMIEAAPVKTIGTGSGAEYEDIPNSSMRKVIAKRLSESKSEIPHYYVTVEIDMGQALKLRDQLNALEGVKISVNDFVIKAVAMTLEKHPLANASYQGSHTRVYNRIDIGMAVAMDDGLITPVIRSANRKGLMEISKQSRELAVRARNKQLKTEEFTGSTFTISNLGMLGVKSFTAVINPPEAAIMAIGATRQVPVVVDGKVEIGYRMDVTVSSDHRVLDGAQTARFLQDFKYTIENPITFAL